MSTTAPVIFNFVSNTLRVVMRDGEPWFVASDVCDALGLDNNRQAVTRLDDDENGVISNDTPSGAQEMTVINESGLYSLILGSRKPEAKKFKKWVTSEVLPAIRKTGRYEVGAGRTAPPPDVAHEQLTNADLGNLTRMIWFICRNLFGESAWTQAVWFRLRQVTGCPAPNRFQVRHLPILASEVRRIWAISEALQTAQRDASRILIKRVLRGGEAEGQVPEEMNKMLAAAVAESEEEMTKRLKRWQEHEMAAITERKAGFHGGYFDAYNEPGAVQ